MEGKSVYAESPDQVYNLRGESFGGMAVSYAVDSAPANLTDDADLKAYKAEEGRASYTGQNIVVTPGAALLVIDLKPGAVTGLHRTVSLDFSICVSGEIEHELDGGEKVRLLPGVGSGRRERKSEAADRCSIGPHHPARNDVSIDCQRTAATRTEKCHLGTSGATLRRRSQLAS